MTSGYALRSLFVTILCFCSPNDPRSLWEEFKDSICDDLPRHLPQLFQHIQDRGQEATMEEAYDYGLFLIDGLLSGLGKSLAIHFPTLPVPVIPWDRYAQVSNQLMREQLAYDVLLEARKFENNSRLLNDDQRHAFEQIEDSVTNNQGRLFFLAAPGGCGKTFLSNTLTHRFRMQQKIVLCVASSGIAALLLIGGRTVHSRFKVPLKAVEDMVCNIKKQDPLAEMLREVALIIWDEAPMQRNLIASETKHAAGGFTRRSRIC